MLVVEMKSGINPMAFMMLIMMGAMLFILLFWKRKNKHRLFRRKTNKPDEAALLYPNN